MSRQEDAETRERNIELISATLGEAFPGAKIGNERGEGNDPFARFGRSFLVTHSDQRSPYRLDVDGAILDDPREDREIADALRISIAEMQERGAACLDTDKETGGILVRRAEALQHAG